jgi:hypothetical protein
MPRERFLQAAERCSLRATTYTYRDGIFIDEPVIDFTKEPNPSRAHRCFNQALDQIDRESPEPRISYIWEWRA